LSASSAEPSLPRLIAPGRRKLLAGLLGVGILAGLFSISIGWLIGRLSSGFSLGVLWLVVALILGFFGSKYLERVVAEKLGQHYVAQLRRGLMSHALRSSRGPSAGITIARSTNDLSSIRNWIVQGLVPLVAGLPLLVVSGVGLWMLHPLLAGSLVLIIVLEAGILLILAPGTFNSARALRKNRGYLAARISDTVAARTAISASGGIDREVNRVQDSSLKVIQASVQRARYAGALRGSALALPLFGTALMVGTASLAGLGHPAVATALTLMGICSGSLGEWGKAVEYRQNYRAGRRIIAPLWQQQRKWSEADRESLSSRDAKELLGHGSAVRIQLPADGGEQFPVLRAQPGERIQVQGTQAQRTEVVQGIATGSLDQYEDRLAGVWIAEGRSEDLPARDRRKLIGSALESMVPERGTLARALRYRHPGASLPRALDLAVDCGLDLEQLPDREQTKLRRGGEPLGRSQQAALLVTRALLREPTVLVLDELLTRLPAQGYEQVVRRINNYPGVVIYAGDLPGIEPTSSWQPVGSPANHQQ